MKILMVNRVLYPRSASETVMFRLADALRALGHEVSFFAQDDARNAALPGAYVVKQMPVGRVAALKRVMYDKGAMECMRQRIRADRPQLALVFQVNRTLSFSVVDALKQKGIPTYVVVTDYTPLCPARTMTRHGRNCNACAARHSFWPCVIHRCLEDHRARSLLGAAEAWQMRQRCRWNLPTGYLVPSDYHRRLLEKSRFTAKPIRTVNLPVDETRFAGFVPKKGDYFLFVGAVETRKGLMTLLRAMAQCVCSLPLAIIGDGPELPAFRRKAAELGLQGRVSFHGQLSSDAVRQAMAEALCVITPSECEEIAPWALLEAQLLGKPAIASRFGVLPERVQEGKNGLLFDPGDSLALAQCLDHMAAMEAGDYQAMAQKTREDALCRYSMRAYACRVLEAVGVNCAGQEE